jgi:hypothetical protein
VLVDFIKRKLKVGGVLYVSYNALPGWTSFSPIRHLMNEHHNLVKDVNSDPISQVKNTFDFTEKFLATDPRFSTYLPLLKPRFDRTKSLDCNYLTHEYFNCDWNPMYFATMAKYLEPAQLQFACSAYYADQLSDLNFTDQQVEFLNNIKDPIFKESVRDFMIDQQFRRDYWVKGIRKILPIERMEQLSNYKVMLIQHRSNITCDLLGFSNNVDMDKSPYGIILDLLTDYKPKTLAWLLQNLKEKEIPLQYLIPTVMILISKQFLSFVQDDETINRMKKNSHSLNLHIINKSQNDDDINYLSSPVTGGGIAIQRLEQLLLLALIQGKKQTNELVQFIMDNLQLQNIIMEKEVYSLEDIKIRIRMEEFTKEFILKKLPILKTLQVIDFEILIDLETKEVASTE